VEDLKRVIKFEKPAVVLVRSTITFTPELLDLGKANGLQAVIRMGAGYDNIDYEYAAEKGISVIRTHGNANSVADLTLYLLAALGKMADFPVKDVTTLAPTPWWSDIAKTEQFEYLKLTLSSKKWPAKDITQTDKDAVSGKIVDRLSSIEEPVLALETVLNGKVVGLLGFGPIPQAVAAKLQKIKETSGADITVIAATRSFDLNDPERLAEAKRLGVQPVTREELFRRANIVSVHVPDGLGLELTREEMSGPNLIAIVNTARENLFPISLASEFVSNRFLVGDFDLKKGFFDLMKEHPDRVMILPHIGASTQDAGRGIEDNTLAVVPELVARLLGKTPSEDAPVVDIVNDVPVPVLPDAAMAATELGWNLGYARDYLQTSIGAASVVNGSERTPELDQEILQNARSAAYELEIIGTAASRKLALRLRAMAVEDLLPREAWDEIRSALDAVQAELTASAALAAKGEVVLSTGESVSAAWAEDLLVGLREDLRFARPEHNKLAFDMMQKMIPNTSGQRLFVLTRHYLAQDLWAFLGRQPGLPAVAAEGLGEDRPFALARIDGEPLGQEILEAVKAWEAQVTDTIRSSSDAAMGAEELEQFDVKVVERLREAIRSGLSVDIQELATSFSEYFRLQPITKGDRFPSLDVVEKSGNHRPRKTVILDKNGESQDYLWFDNLPSGVQGKAYWISLTDRPLLVLVMDNAQVVKTPGGIDLRNGEYLKVIERDASGMPVFDPAQVEKLRQDLRGFMPVPIGAPQPVNLRQLLGLADDGTPLLPQTAGATVTPAVIPDAAFLDRREAGEEALV
jgi:phosphoglycerate dehydrogenase-like enzyme